MAAVGTVSGSIYVPYIDNRSPLQKVVHLVVSLFRQAKYSLAVFYHRHFCSNPTLGPRTEWKAGSEGLVVLIHGLNNSSSSWYSQLSLLSQHDKIDVFAPEVFKRGRCSLDEAVDSILPPILDYTRKNPKKPVCLLGTSNGGRITAQVETVFRQKSPSTPIMVSNIAGVHFGSQRMNLLEKLGLGKWLYPAVLRQELQYGSPKAKELLSQINEPLPDGCAARAYEFYATTEDLTIDLDSSLPKIINLERKYHMIHAHSHGSIVTGVAERQIHSCCQWIKRFPKE